MSYSQKFIPAAGRVAVVREYVDEVASKVVRDDGTVVQIFQTEDQADFKRRVNPWALVVGVGPRKWSQGEWIEPPCQEGDRVLVGQVGTSATLSAADGTEEIIYVVPFEGVVGRMESTCSVCGREYRTTAPDECQCGGIVRPVGLVTP